MHRNRLAQRAGRWQRKLAFFAQKAFYLDILKNENIIKIENVKEKRQMETEIAEVFMNPVRQRIIQ